MVNCGDFLVDCIAVKIEKDRAKLFPRFPRVFPQMTKVFSLGHLRENREGNEGNINPDLLYVEFFSLFPFPRAIFEFR